LLARSWTASVHFDRYSGRAERASHFLVTSNNRITTGSGIALLSSPFKGEVGRGMGEMHRLPHLFALCSKWRDGTTVEKIAGNELMQRLLREEDYAQRTRNFL